MYLDLELKRSKIYMQRIELIEKRYLNKYPVTDALLRHYERIKRFVKSVEEALQELSPLHREFFELYYHKGKKIEKITIEMSITQYTVEKLRREILGKVAEKMGFLEEENKVCGGKSRSN